MKYEVRITPEELMKLLAKSPGTESLQFPEDADMSAVFSGGKKEEAVLVNNDFDLLIEWEENP